MSRTKTTILVSVLIFVAFVAGNVTGFVAGVCSIEAGRQFLADMFNDEESADVAAPQQIARAGFSLKYPGNWHIDVQDEDYDPDHLFTIESPGSSMVMFFLFDSPTDPETNVRTQLDSFASKLVSNAEESEFENWGSFLGKGLLIKGRLLGIFKGHVRIFSYSSATRSFIVVEQTYDDDRSFVELGIRLIESSMSLQNEL